MPILRQSGLIPRACFLACENRVFFLLGSPKFVADEPAFGKVSVDVYPRTTFLLLKYLKQKFTSNE
jgi:hypothetical protein